MAELNSQNDNDNDDDDFDHLVTHVVMYDEMVQTGLHIANFSETQILRGTEVINISRFRQNYGVLPTLCCTIYEDLQKSAAVDNSSTPPTIMRLTGSHTQFKWFLRALYYLRKYPLETDFAKDLKVSSEHYARDRIWEMITRIQYLKLTKITWPDDLGGGDVWVITVDGTHVWLKEPTHAEFSQDSKYWSHKFNKAGFNYELGIAVASQKLVWMNGPFKAGRSDKQIFVENGLKQKLLQLGKKCIGDGAYNGHLDVASYPNYHDSYSVKKFKSRALKRHEAFNGMTKNFKILDYSILVLTAKISSWETFDPHTFPFPHLPRLPSANVVIQILAIECIPYDSWLRLHCFLRVHRMQPDHLQLYLCLWKKLIGGCSVYPRTYRNDIQDILYAYYIYPLGPLCSYFVDL